MKNQTTSGSDQNRNERHIRRPGDENSRYLCRKKILNRKLVFGVENKKEFLRGNYLQPFFSIIIYYADSIYTDIISQCEKY